MQKPIERRTEMRKWKLDNRCAKCWCFKQERCAGCYDKVAEDKAESGDVIETFYYGCDNLRSPGDAECAEQLVTVEEGHIFINYEYQYSIGPLDTITKEEMVEMMYHLRNDKLWYSIFLESVFVRRVIELKGWTSEIVLDSRKM